MSSGTGYIASVEQLSTVPNFAVDLLTGKTYQVDAYLSGEIHSQSGQIGGWTIEQSQLYQTVGNFSIGLGIRNQQYPEFSIWHSDNSDIVGGGLMLLNITRRILGLLFSDPRSSHEAYCAYTNDGVLITNDSSLIGSEISAQQVQNNNNIFFYAGVDGQFRTAGGNIQCWKDQSYHVVVNTSSDSRLKDVIKNTELTVEQIANAPSVVFSWKSDEKKRRRAGSIAQYWKKILPEVVSEDNEGFLSLDYQTLAAVCAIDLAKEVLRLKQENEELKKRLAKIEEVLGIKTD
jgi:hypothetical protein